jgi:putative phosphoesterase
MENKKLLVLSDTHGDVTSLKAALNWAKDHIPPNDTILAAAFLGDGLSDLQSAADAAGFYSDWKLVGGNNDYGISMPEALTFDFAEHRFFMCHGHRYSLYGGYHTLITAAKNAGADIALYGHTHIPYYKIVNGISLVNPGSVGRPRSRIGATFALIECQENRPLNVRFFKIGTRKEIGELNI